MPTPVSHQKADSPSTIPLFLDCDPGIDDAVALGYLLCQADVDVVGIAASGGNVPTSQVVDNALGWLTLAGRTDIPVHPGAAAPLAQEPEYADDTHGPTGTGYATLPEPVVTADGADAARAWVAAAHAHPGELIGVLLGPCTNLALALDLEPELPRLLKRIFIMGGAFNYRGNTRPTTEWNVTWDPEATSRVLAAFGGAFANEDAPFAPVIGPIEATEAVALTPQQLDDVLTGHRPTGGQRPAGNHSQAGTGTGTPAHPATASPSGGSAPAWHEWLTQLGEALRFYFEFHEADGHGYLAHIHDPYVLAAAVGWARQVPGPAQGPAAARAATASPVPWAQTTAAPVDVELTGMLTRGETVADWLGRWNRPANAEIIRRVDAPAFLNHLTATLKKGPDCVTGR